MFVALCLKQPNAQGHNILLSGAFNTETKDGGSFFHGKNSLSTKDLRQDAEYFMHGNP